MQSRDIEANDLFNFDELGAIIQEGQDQKTYYKRLLAERDGARQAFLAVYPEATEEEIEEGIHEYLQDKPVNTWRRAVTDTWVRRGHHFLTKVVPLAVIAAAAGTFHLGKQAYQAHQLRVAEETAEAYVVDLDRRQNILYDRIEAARAHNARETLPDHLEQTLNNRLNRAETALDQANPLFAEFLGADGTATEAVNQSNFTYVTTKGDEAKTSIEEALANLTEAENILGEQQFLNEAEGELSTALSVLERNNAPTNWMAQGQEAYRQAMQARNFRDREGTQLGIDRLKELINNTNDYHMLQEEARATIAQAEALGCSVAQLSESGLYNSARLFQDSEQALGLEGMRTATNELNSITAKLSETYEMRAVGGAWFFAFRDRSIRNYYVRTIAERGGENVWVTIHDDYTPERGDVKTPQWGEEVPKRVYDWLGENGIPRRNNILGQKSRCETEPTYDWTLDMGWGKEYVMTESMSRITPNNPDRELDPQKGGGKNWRPTG